MARRPADLGAIAWRAMLAYGLEPAFSPAAEQETAALRAPATLDGAAIVDLRRLLWFSIDNDDSRDLDQLTIAEPLADGVVRLRVAIADVDALVARGDAIDAHAHHNTTSVYTAARIFPMLPERLSTPVSTPSSVSTTRSPRRSSASATSTAPSTSRRSSPKWSCGTARSSSFARSTRTARAS
jgi:exoribonuclease II